MSIFLYSFFKNKKTVFTDNLLLVRYDNVGVGIPLNIINKEDKEKVEWYIQKYLNKDINQLERKIIPPEYRSWNLVSEERKEQILKEKFKK